MPRGDRYLRNSCQGFFDGYNLIKLYHGLVKGIDRDPDMAGARAAAAR